VLLFCLFVQIVLQNCVDSSIIRLILVYAFIDGLYLLIGFGSIGVGVED